MHADVIKQLAAATLSGSLPFPEIIGHLMDEGVEYYHVDFAAKSFSFYSTDGEVLIAPIAYENLPKIAADFNVLELRAAILDSQQHGQKFHDFCIRALHAGVQSYFVFLRGQRVLYIGRQGDQHLEWFPGAQHEVK